MKAFGFVALVCSLLISFCTSELHSQVVSYEDLESGKKGKCTTYISKDGRTFNIGDTLRFGKATGIDKFLYVQESSWDFQGDGYDDVPADVSGNRTIIKGFYISGNKRTGRSILVQGKALTFLTSYYIKLEQALESGEIKGAGLTSDEALEQLKKAKDKYDLGLISKQEYDTIKTELSKHIK